MTRNQKIKSVERQIANCRNRERTLTATLQTLRQACENNIPDIPKECVIEIDNTRCTFFEGHSRWRSYLPRVRYCRILCPTCNRQLNASFSHWWKPGWKKTCPLCYTSCFGLPIKEDS